MNSIRKLVMPHDYSLKIPVFLIKNEIFANNNWQIFYAPTKSILTKRCPILFLRCQICIGELYLDLFCVYKWCTQQSAIKVMEG